MSAPSARAVDPAVDRDDRRYRRTVFAGIFLGYAAHYLVRNNLALAIRIDYATLIAIGFLIYGPIMLIGLHTLDLVPKKAAGTAAGFTGSFVYVFGSAIAGTGVGWIADRWDWNGVFIAMVACCVLAIVFSAMTLGHTATSESRS